MINSTLSPPSFTTNLTSLNGGAVGAPKDSFSAALTKNIVAMLVWLALSFINGSMVHTFLRHCCFSCLCLFVCVCVCVCVCV